MMENTETNLTHAFKPIMRQQYHNTVYQNKENDKDFLEDLRALAAKSTLLVNPFNSAAFSQEIINEIAIKAQIHQKAMRPSIPSKLESSNGASGQACQCGCRRVNGQPIPLCTDMDDMKFLGTAVTLYFFYIKMCILIVVFLTMFYSIYAFCTNMMGDDAQFEYNDCNGSLFCEFKVATSLKKKQSWNGYVLIQYWLSLGACLFIIGTIWVINHIGERINQSVGIATNTPSDRAVKIQNLPYGNNTQSEIIQCFRKVWLNRKRGKPNQIRNLIDIKSIHIVYNMKSIRELILSIRDQAIQLSDRKIISKTNEGVIKISEVEYIDKKRKLIRDLIELEDALKRFNNQETYRQNLSTTCAILQFFSIQDKQRFLNTFGVNNSTRIKKILRVMGCMSQKTIMFKGKALTVQQASEPEDIYWENCQIQYNVCVSVGIWLAAAVIILLTLGALIGIEYGQAYLTINYPNLSQNIFTIINYCKTIILVVINKCIWILLSWLIKRQRNHTLSDQMISLISTSVFAQTVNSIGLTFISQLITNQNYYGSEGVTGVAFDFAVSNSIYTNIIMFFDFGYIISRFIIWVKCFRNFFIRFYSRGLDPKSLEYNIPDVNKLYEGGEFSMTQSYTTIIVALLHMSFFATMEPFIIIIVCIGLIAHFFLKRYLLIRRYNYPKLLDKRVFEHGIHCLKYIPIFHGTGMMVTIVITYTVAEKWYLFIPGGICVLLGIINLFNPGKIFDHLTRWGAKTCFKEKKRTRLSDNTDTSNINYYQTDQNGKTSKYIQYYETSNLSTLIGYRSILEQGVASKADRAQLKEFVQSFNTRRENEYHYPKLEDTALKL